MRRVKEIKLRVGKDTDNRKNISFCNLIDW